MAKATKGTQAETTFNHLNDVMDKAGFDDINLETMSVPFIRLLQDLSPQLKKNKPEFIAEAEAGQFVNTVNNRLYDSPLRIVVGKFERYIIEWGAARGEFSGAHSVEVFETQIMPKLVRNEKKKLIDPNTGHSFADTYVYYVILPDYMEEGVCILSITSTGIKEAKKLNRNLTHTMIPNSDKRALPYFMVWNAEVTEMSNDQGDWLGIKFTFDSFVTQEQLTCVVAEREALPNKNIDMAMLAAPESSSDNDGGEVKY